MWVCSVAYFSGAIVSSNEAKLPLSPSKRRLKRDSCITFMSHHWCLWLFMGLVLVSMLFAFIVSFLAFPEAQTASQLCNSDITPLKLSDLAPVNLTSLHTSGQATSVAFSEASAASHIISLSTGNKVSEITAEMCDTIIRVRILKDGYPDKDSSKSGERHMKHRRWRSIEVDAHSQVEHGSEIFLRVDLDKLLESTLSLQSSKKTERSYSAVTSDGWWEMARNYDWYSPLSANFRPISSIVTFLISTTEVSSSQFASMSENQNTGMFVEALTLSPSHPIGMVLHRGLVDMTMHRSLRVDDEKGLQEALKDNTRSFTSFKIKHMLIEDEIIKPTTATGKSHAIVSVGVPSKAGDQLVVYATSDSVGSLSDRYVGRTFDNNFEIMLYLKM